MPPAADADILVNSGDSVLAHTSSTPSSRIRHAALFGSIVAWARYGSVYVPSMTVGASVRLRRRLAVVTRGDRLLA